MYSYKDIPIVIAMIMIISTDLSWQIILDFMSDLIEFYEKKNKDCILMNVPD